MQLVSARRGIERFVMISVPATPYDWKLGVRDRTRAVLRGLELGLIPAAIRQARCHAAMARVALR